MEDKYVKLKSETIRGRKVDFYEWKIYSPKQKKYVKELVVVNVQGLKPSNGRKFFTGGSSKKALMNKLDFMIRNAIENRAVEAQLKKSLKFKFPKLKIFYYKIVKETKRYYGGMNVTAEVFEHTPSGMKNLGEVKWTTSSYKGEESEVLDFLKEKGVVPKGMFPTGYYSWSDAEKYNIKISRL